MDISQRLKTAISTKYKTLKEFSKHSNIPYVTLQRYFSGTRKPNSDVLYDLSSQLDISIDWLLTGEGQIFKGEKKPDTAQSPKWFTDWWQHADDEHRTWLKIQLKQTPPVTK